MLPGERRRAIFDTTRAAVAALLTVGLLLWTWADLWTDAPVARLLTVALCGALPAIAIVADRGIWPRVGLVVAWLASIVVVIGTATDVSIASLLRLRGTAWTSVRVLINEGFSTAATVDIPLAGGDHRPITALIMIVIATTTSALVALAFVARRPFAAVIALVVAIAYRWTLVPPPHALRDGLIVTGGMLAIVALLRFRPGSGLRQPFRVVVSGGVVLAIAGLVASAGWGHGAWWDWQNWSWGQGTPQSLVVSPTQSYGPLKYDRDPITIARIRTDEPMSLRQVSLRSFDGARFVDDRERAERALVDGDFTAPRTGSGEGREVTQTVEFAALRSDWLLSAGQVTRVTGVGRRQVSAYPDGTMAVSPGFGRGTSYRVTSVIPDPGVPTLLAARDYRSGEVNDADLTLRIGSGHPDVTAPLFGSDAPSLDPDDFGPYADVYELSHQVIGDAASPYVAVNRLESFLRNRSEFTYDTAAAGPTNGTPELAYFLLESRTGYCQQFAGSLALMLRMNGIPARVAVGLNVTMDGYDASSDTYAVTDRDVHSWVEVKLPGQDWLPFDPTPIGSASNSASVSSGSYVPPDAAPDAGTDIAPAPVDPPDIVPTPDPGPDVTSDPGPDPSAAADGGMGRRWTVIAFGGGLLVAIVLVAVPVAKGVRRRRRRRGDPRTQVLGAAREVESLLVDLGAPPDRAATSDERAGAARRDVGVETDRVYRLARAAQFSPVPPTADDAAMAWDDVDAIRRALPWRRRIAVGLRLRSLRAER